MLVKALKSFSGKVAMVKDQIKDIKDEVVLADLLRAKYVEAVATVKPVQKEEPKEVVKAEPKKATRKATKKKTPKGE